MHVRRAHAALTALLLAALGLQPQAASARSDPFPPVLTRFADPGVAAYPGGYVAVATGSYVQRATAPSIAGPWTKTAPALAAMPSWATTPSVWAPDLEKVGDRWLMYYSATVAGLGPTGRCIGVAVAASPTDPFTPYGDRPLVCPRKADTKRAADPVKRPRSMPQKGVIDPSFFRTKDGRPYLVYKTDLIPSSIRMVRLKRSGLAIHAKATSKQLIRSKGVMENPFVVQRGKRFVLVTSEQSFATCKYRIYWRSTRDVWDWRKAEKHQLLSRRTSGLCGPGGADVLREGGRTTMFLHSWVCGKPALPCPADFNLGTNPYAPSSRSMYAVSMRWYRSLMYPDSFYQPARRTTAQTGRWTGRIEPAASG